MKDIEIPFVMGQDTSGSPGAVSEPGKLRMAHNVHIQPANADALTVRRSGTAVLEVERTGPRRLVNCEDTVNLVQPTQILSANSADTQWTNTSVVRNVDIVSVTPVELSANSRSLTVATSLARDADGDEVWVLMSLAPGEDIQLLGQAFVGGQTRGMQLIASLPVGAPGANHPQSLFAFADSANGTFIILHSDPNATTFYARRYTKATGLWSLTTTFATATLLDAAQLVGGIGVAYRDEATGFLRFARFNQDGSLFGTALVNGVQSGASHACIAQVSSSTVVHIWSANYVADGNTIRGFRVNPTTLTVTVGGTLVSPVGEVRHMVCCNGTQTNTSWCYIAGNSPGSANIGGLLSNTGNMATIVDYGFTSRFEPHAKLWVPPVYGNDASYDGADPGPYILATLGTQVGIWQIHTQSGAVSPPQRCVLMHSGTRGVYRNGVTLNGDMRARGHTLYVNGETGRALIPTSSGPEVIEWGVREVRAQHDNHAGFCVMSLGAPKYFDGAKWVPIGFSQAPTYAISAVASGSPLAAGVYTYAAVWEWSDARGRRHQGPTAVTTVTLNGSQRARLVVNGWSVPADERGLDPSGRTRIAVYRSLAGGNTLYRAYTVEPPLTASTFNVDDTSTDAVVGVSEILYTTAFGGNELQAFGLDACDIVVGYSDRLIVHHPAFPSKLFYSKSLRDGRVWEFNPVLSFFVPGEVTGLATQDGNVYVFTANNVYSMAPQFANDDGTGAVPIDAIPLSADTGMPAEYRASIVKTPDGVFFRSYRGFFVIPRGGGAPVYVGRQLEGNLLSAVLGGAHNPATSEVCWVTSFGAQQVVVYNYLYGQWFTWEFFTGAGLTFGGGVISRLRNGFFYFGEGSDSLSGWTVVRQDALMQGQDFADANVDIPVVIETADFDISDIGKRTRVNNLVLDAAWTQAGSVLSIEESHDSGSSYQNTVNYSFAAAPEPVVYQVAVRKTRGIRFRLRSIARTTGMRLYGVTIKCKALAKAVTSSASRKG